MGNESSPEYKTTLLEQIGHLEGGNQEANYLISQVNFCYSDNQGRTNANVNFAWNAKTPKNYNSGRATK